jgi:hypothetical protein
MKIAVDLGASNAFGLEDRIASVDRSTTFEEEDGRAGTYSRARGKKMRDDNEFRYFPALKAWKR